MKDLGRELGRSQREIVKKLLGIIFNIVTVNEHRGLGNRLKLKIF